MDSNALYMSFNEVDDDILERSERAILATGIPLRRRLPVVLIAAILALFLMGSSAVVFFFGDSIQSWFAYYWKSITGESMSNQHAALIDHLSQQIGSSETVDGVTVTVDSATVGERNFFILLRVEGLELSNKHFHGFEEVQLTLKQVPEQHVGGAGYSYDYLGLNPDGAALLLIHYDYSVRGPASEDKPPLQITLSMTDFVQGDKGNKHILLAEGTWNFYISLDRNQLDAKELPDTQVMGIAYSENNEKTETPVTLTNMVLTNTDICFQYDWQGGDVVLETRLQEIRVVLQNGLEISAGSGDGSGLASTQWYVTYTWRIPVSLEEVAAVKIGDVIIPVE